MPRGVQVARNGQDVTLELGAAVVRWKESCRFWEVEWKWTDNSPAHLGSGIGEYSGGKLSADQVKHYEAEVAAWIENGWLTPHDATVHGPVVAVLPLIAVCQEHKASTPIRPVMYYRYLNKAIDSNPGPDVPSCNQKLRDWPLRGQE